MPCQNCPCPEICLARPSFCEWAAKDPPDPIALKHICVRSAMGDTITAYPPATTMMMNAAGSLVGFLASGFSFVSQEERERRLAICEVCEHFDREPQRCRICGCFATWKARIESEHCPLPEPKW